MRRGLAHTRSGSRSVLPVIAEVDDDAPTVPEKAARWPPPGGGLRSHPLPFLAPLEYPPRTAPPSRGRIIESLPSPTVRRSSRAAKRGGWYRLALIISVTIAIIVALAVGLSLGLRHNERTRTSPVPSDHQQSVLFPAGSYAFVTALSQVSTACTSNPDAFHCYAYATYNGSHAGTAASATFYWTIAEAGAGAYVVSAATNPFGPQFANTTMRLLDGSQPAERLTFEVPLVATVVPTAALDRASNRAVTCYYNDTLLSATLWTRRPAEYPVAAARAAHLTNAAANARTFGWWPYAVEIRQAARAGPAVPDCRDVAGRRVGDVSLPAGQSGECSCAYANFGLDSRGGGGGG